MASKLTKRAREWLEQSNCFEEVDDDYVVVSEAGIRILLSKRAVEDLNRQAREAQET